MTSRPATDAPAASETVAATPVPTCCSRPMSTISVTEDDTELTLLSCSSCSRHAWLKDGVLLDRDGMLAAVRKRLSEAPRPKGGRPKGSGKKAAVPSPRTTAAGTTDSATAARAQDMRNMLSGFRVLGQ